MKDKEFIDLGQDYGDGMVAEAREARKSYPTLCICSDEPIELPDGEFKFTAIGRRVEMSANDRDPEDPKFRYEIEVKGIAPGASVESDEDDEEEEETVVLAKGKDPVDELEKAMRGEE